MPGIFYAEKQKEAVSTAVTAKAEEKHHTETKEKKKLSAKERESSKLREYTAELPTPDDINVDVYSSMMGGPKKKEPVIEIKINKPQKPKEIAFEMTGPVLTAEPRKYRRKRNKIQRND